MSSKIDETNFTAFKRAQVRYRRQGKQPNRSDDLSEVVDFGSIGDDRILKLELPECFRKKNDVYKGPIYGLKGFPGFVFFPQALAQDLQVEIAFQSVREFCEPPNRTNIDSCPRKPIEENNCDESMWELWKKSTLFKTKPKKQKIESAKKYRSFEKLSWATMGYHYDWTERSYNNESKSPMPTFLGNLSKIFAQTSLVLDSAESSGTKTEIQFSPEASIVNYYNVKSLMGGHRDDLELALDKPVVSMSMGLPAIFLLGGHSKDEEPVIPILIRPGDVMCLGGDVRQNYHSMARLLPNEVSLPIMDETLCPSKDGRLSRGSIASIFPSQHNDDTMDILSVDRVALEEYLTHHRININVRQVYADEK